MMTVLIQPGVTRYIHKEDSFLVDYTQRQNPYESKKDHLHETYEIYYLFSGHRKYFIKDRVYTVERGDLVFIPKYTVHSTLNGDSLTHERVVLNFNETFLENYFENRSELDLLGPFNKNIPTLRLETEDRHYIEGLLHRMMKELKEQPLGYVVYLKALTVELLLYLVRCIDKYEVTESPFDNPMQRKVSEIVNYIHENFRESLTLAKLSKEFYMSTYYLSRVFKEVSGFSFVEYLNQVRIKEAQRLLRETKQGVLQVSEQVGFESIAHFGRVFKQTTNLSPTRYRHMQQWVQ